MGYSGYGHKFEQTHPHTNKVKIIVGIFNKCKTKTKKS